MRPLFLTPVILTTFVPSLFVSSTRSAYPSLSSECLDVCDGFASKTLCEEVDLIAFHVLDDEDVEALQEGKGCVIDCITQDGFLDE